MPAGSRVWRITRRVLITLGVLAVVFFFGVVPWFFTHILTRGRFDFPDPNNGKTPQSYGLDFRWVEFRSTDGILLRGWYIPVRSEARGTIIYCHGLNRWRIEMLPRAAFGHRLGYNVLLFDFRHAGRSEGEITTLGYHERHDILGAIRYALSEEHAAPPVILWGVSMGAAAALMAAADSPEVAAVISDSTFLSYRETIRHHTRMFLRLPSFPIADEVIYWSARRGNFDPADFDLEKAVERIGSRPILFVAVENDRRMPPDIARRLHAHAASPQKALVVLPGSRHGEGFNHSPEKYQSAVARFLEQIPAPSARQGGEAAPRAGAPKPNSFQGGKGIIR